MLQENRSGQAGTAPRIRAMRVDDIDEIVALERLCFTLPWSATAFLNELTGNHFAFYIVLELEGAIAGYGGMWTILDEAHVTNIAVHPDCRGKGYGEKLLGELMDTASLLGCSAMTLEVRKSNAVAISLYEKMGFAATGVRKGYYSDNGEDALIMWADLKLGLTDKDEWT